MSTERTTLSAQVDSDTELAKQFEEYREQNAMTSRSEAVRHLVRAGLKQEGRLASPGSDDTEHDGSGDTLLMVQNLAALASATAALSLALIISIIGVVGISPTWVTMMLTTAVASIAFGGVVTFTVAKIARASWASKLGVEVPGGAGR